MTSHHGPAAGDAHDAIILGGGLAGLALALALARQDMTSLVIDPSPRAPLADPAEDGRASALARTSWQLLVNLGVAERLGAAACPIDRIAVCEALKPGALDFAEEAVEPDVLGTQCPGVMGMMVPNAALRSALLDAADQQPAITLAYEARVAERRIGPHAAEVVLEDGRRFEAPLLVGAEGRASPTRRQAGIELTQWHYRQQGIVSAIAFERPHANTAYEIFYSDGPLAILPLTDDADGRHRASIVWTVPDDQAPAWLGLSDRAFAAALEEKMGGFLGTITMLAPRSAFPLGFHQASAMVSERLALVGDAAHGIHPIAGQGLNLALRDVAALAAVLDDAARLGLDLGDLAQLKRYEAWRGLDNAMMGVATDVLNRLFRLPGGAASAVRRFGLGTVQRSGLLKRFFIGEARGEAGDLPPLLQTAA